MSFSVHNSFTPRCTSTQSPIKKIYYVIGRNTVCNHGEIRILSSVNSFFSLRKFWRTKTFVTGQRSECEMCKILISQPFVSGLGFWEPAGLTSLSLLFWLFHLKDGNPRTQTSKKAFETEINLPTTINENLLWEHKSSNHS